MRNSMSGLLDIMTKVWFFKLKNMKRAKESIKKSHHPNTIPKQPFTPNRASYYYPSTAEAKLPGSPSNPMASDIQFSIDPPRKSKRSREKTKNKSTKKLVNSSIANLCIHSDHLKKGKITSIAAADIIIEVSPKNSLELNDFVVVSELKLSPILADKQRCIKRPAKRSPVGLHRLRMHACSSPKLSSKRVPVQKGQKSSGSPTRARKKLSESFAVVISSANPEKDFRESMVEMIVENNIRASKDLEELLASYLTLNSNEYHAVIIKVFQQIWFDLSDIITL